MQGERKKLFQTSEASEVLEQAVNNIHRKIQKIQLDSK